MANVVLSLAITSSTAVVGVAVGPLGGKAVSFHQVETDRRHAEELTPLIERVISEAGIDIGHLSSLVVDVGPGRFTGLRVGLATARTLALALDVGVIGLTSLEILAAAESERPAVAVVDARRAEVFQQRFESTGPAGPAVVGVPGELAGQAIGAVIVGDGADRYADVYGEGVVRGRAPSAATMLAVAIDRPPQPGVTVAPVYLRDPDVQINVKTRHTSS